jgi:hypothetical protein
MLWTIFVVILILWLLGFSLHVAGGLIHLLLVVALVVLVINLVSGPQRGVKEQVWHLLGAAFACAATVLAQPDAAGSRCAGHE